MNDQDLSNETLSPWWRRSVLLIIFAGFALLIGIAVITPRNAPPIPLFVKTSAGETLLTRDDIPFTCVKRFLT